jgi:uncharacterized protein (DUF2147 family)
MKTLRLTLAALAVAAMGSAAHAAADPVEGLWLVQGGSAKVRIAPCAGNGAQMCGTITWLKNPNDKAGRPLKDVRNPDAAQRAKPLLGLTMIRDFKPTGPGKWGGGKIYDPGAGKTYGSKMSLNPDGTLKVEGCIAMICQAQTWKRTS